MTAISGHSKQNIVVALVDRDDIWTEESVIESRKKEEWLLDLVESVMDVACFFEFVDTLKTSLTVVDFR